MVIGNILAGLGGFGLGELFSGFTKKEVSTVTHAPYETYSPQTTFAQQYSIVYPSYQVAIESPFASQSATRQTEQQARLQPTQEVTPGNVLGTDYTTIAIIGVVGLVAYGLVSKPRRR